MLRSLRTANASRGWRPQRENHLCSSRPPAPGDKPRRVTAGALGGQHSEDTPAWSPDGQRLAFLSDAAKPGQSQLYVTTMGAGPARKLTSVKGLLAAPAWSPDGKRLGILFTENANRAAGPLVAEAAQTGVIKDAVTEQRLAVVDAAGGKLNQISPPDMYVYEFDWSPDSTRFVTTAAHGNGDNNWYIAEIYTVSASGGDMKSIYKPTLQVANPAWSPDGRSVAFISGLMSDEPSVGGDVYVVPAEGGEARNITPEMKASASWLTWTGPQTILFGEDVDGESGVATVDVSAGKIETAVARPGADLSQRVRLGRKRWKNVRGCTPVTQPAAGSMGWAAWTVETNYLSESRSQARMGRSKEPALVQ